MRCEAVCLDGLAAPGLSLIHISDTGPQLYEFKYSAIGDGSDHISKVGVLACMLIIGDKCVAYSFRIAMTAQNGTQTTVYHTYYKLYHDALMEAGISLPTGKNGIM